VDVEAAGEEEEEQQLCITAQELEAVSVLMSC
jgi:hypothetical protein